MKPFSATWPQVHSFRLARHRLSKRASPRDLVRVAGEVGGLQAQVTSFAASALRARVEGLSAADVAHALWTDRSLVRLWCMRGTAHIVPAREVRLYACAVGRSAFARNARWLARYRVTTAEMEQILDVVVDTLGDNALTRKELGERAEPRLAPKARTWVALTWGGVLQVASFRGLLCFGPSRGAETTFVRTEVWVPKAARFEEEEAQDELVRRYLSAFGPATAADFAKWSGMASGEARSAFARLERETTQVDVEGASMAILSRDRAKLTARGPGPVVRLLDCFDGYLLAHRDKAHLVDEEHYKSVYRSAGWIAPVVLVDGRVAGTWEREKGESIRLNPLSPWSKAVSDAVAHEVADVKRFHSATLSESEDAQQV